MAAEENGTQHNENLDCIQECEPPILKAEVEAALRKLNNHKAPGSDKILAEMLKNSGDRDTALLYQICTKVWETGKWPEDWTRSPLHKKGAKDESIIKPLLLLAMLAKFFYKSRRND